MLSLMSSFFIVEIIFLISPWFNLGPERSELTGLGHDVHGSYHEFLRWYASHLLPYDEPQ